MTIKNVDYMRKFYLRENIFFSRKFIFNYFLNYQIPDEMMHASTQVSYVCIYYYLFLH